VKKTFRIQNDDKTEKCPSSRQAPVRESMPQTEDVSEPWIVSARKEDLLRILENLPCGIVVNRHPLGKILYVNPGAIEMMGYTLEDAPTGRDAWNAFEPDPKERKRTRKLWETSWKKNSGTVIDRFLAKDGTTKSCEIRFSKLPNGIVMTTWADVTSRVEAEAALRKLNEELEDRVQQRAEEIGTLAAEREALLQEVQVRREKDLKQSRDDLRSLSDHLQRAREEERTRIAREVHDEIGQFLSALRLDLSCLNETLPECGTGETDQIRSMTNKIDAALETVGKICSELRPSILDDFGLAAAIEWHCEKLTERTGMVCTVKVSPGLPDLDKDLALVLFRIFQEAMTNIIRHAAATVVKVSLKKERDRLVLKVADNGSGITHKKILSPGSLGIIGIRERLRFWKGDVTFKGIRNKGTTMTTIIPFDISHDPAKNLGIKNGSRSGEARDL
jgi:PAS domain S-box-containing protein